MLDYPMYPNLPAADIERARRWYSEKLLLEPAVDLGFGGLVYVAGGTPFLVYPTDNAGTARNTAAVWVVDDLDRVMADLRSRGVTFEDYAMGDRGPTTENGIASDPSGGRAAWFKDSEGNVLNLVQMPPGMSVDAWVAAGR